MRKLSIGLLAFIGLAFAYLAYAQTAKETIEKRKIEKYIELGSGDFAIADDVNIDGNVGIGTSSPGVQFEVYNDTTSAIAKIKTTQDSPAGLRLEAGTGGSGNIYFGDAIDGAQGRIIYNHADDSMKFYTSSDGNNGTVNMTINSSGNVDIASGNLNFETAAKGITFNSGDTLAYYDEGYWTPTMSGATLSNTVTAYTRIGDFVRFHIVFRVDSVTTGTNEACLSLPTNAEYGGAYVTYQNASNNTVMPPYTWSIIDASNTLCLRTTAGVAVNITTAFGTGGSGAQYHLTGSYGVD